MKIFVDTAKIEEIRKVKEWGILDGVTTNPTLLSQTGKPWKEAALEILKEVPDKPVSLEVIATDFEGMVKEAKELAKMGDNVVVKIPFTYEGIKAVQALKAEGIKTNVTLVFSSLQALLAGKAGATYVSPFIGRVDDIAYNGMEVLEEIIQIYNLYDFETQIIAASIRHVDHVKNCALLGVDIATIPFKVIEQMFKHPLTDVGLKRFLEDAKKANITIL
ncbi:transaldolase [Thermodesulfobacterium geofontis OPF15]|jgi:transaldolase (EC 2.2.1.2)|uniref:Probable transaldolase n=1 Tax=Thermodesulfobacterium geofontis (strain OPF15) TaxID=795359 RepID=F8C488_THEGP|nr:fructose-6-phosphate aldolase [Thermodesulfobacterium geofontis]AEH22589.1 transaldolase [Thermodesulfobacterium geofontis OPF15]